MNREPFQWAIGRFPHFFHRSFIFFLAAPLKPRSICYQSDTFFSSVRDISLSLPYKLLPINRIYCISFSNILDRSRRGNQFTHRDDPDSALSKSLPITSLAPVWTVVKRDSMSHLLPIRAHSFIELLPFRNRKKPRLIPVVSLLIPFEW